jgi:hypothetical protein
MFAMRWSRLLLIAAAVVGASPAQAQSPNTGKPGNNAVVGAPGTTWSVTNCDDNGTCRVQECKTDLLNNTVCDNTSLERPSNKEEAERQLQRQLQRQLLRDLPDVTSLAHKLGDGPNNPLPSTPHRLYRSRADFRPGG